MTTFSNEIWGQCEQRYLCDPQAYIALQDKYQVNVNLLLLAQYLDQQSYQLSLKHWQQLANVIAPWEAEVLKPYRQLRRLAKAHLAIDEYQKMLKVELMLERKSQTMLLQHINLIQAEPTASDNTGKDALVNIHPPINVTVSTASHNSCHYLSLFGLTVAHLPG
ncbi:TIGR02444 family protein [Shewanella sp. OMA3-2]|uniref:TIGR02444 family protein n=1 Tax=Shewanella sp. OMA3-2 TaxID=2908650 RepID=UPI001F447672|nr:TIGR02444 family protein [Shewanella sp. OMA3-2]UJF21740.1 TIGR02444 family protein [Shewanella sp. OMA3-2]